MRIVDIREKSFPIGGNIKNAAINFNMMTISAVAVITDVIRDGKPIIGFGFNSNGRYAQSEIIKTRLIPRALALREIDQLNALGDNIDPLKLKRAMMKDEKPGGHAGTAVAVAAVEIALWDAAAKIYDLPLWAMINTETPDKKPYVYAAGGYYNEQDDTEELINEVKGYINQGYKLIKMKIGGASLDKDRQRIEAALKILGTGDNLAVDANGKFDRDTAFAYCNALEPYALRWFEEPCDPVDYALTAEIARYYPYPIATGENIFSQQEAKNLIKYAGLRPELDYLQFDPALAYGVSETVDITEMIEENSWSRKKFFPHGGNLLALSLTGALRLGGCESYPGVFQPFGGFTDSSIIEDGFIPLSDAPGIGFEEKISLYETLKTLIS